MFGFGVLAIEIWHTDFPVWALLVALVSGSIEVFVIPIAEFTVVQLLAFVYVIPIGMIQAITNQQVGLK